MKKIVSGFIGLGFMVAGGAANAGSIFLTGHDILLHSNQNGYSTTILEWLRGAGTGSEIATDDYRVGLVSGGVGFASTTVLDDYGAADGGLDVRLMSSFADGDAFASFLSGIDVLVIPSHTSCGGCNFTDAASAALNGFSAQITSFFNAGGDIWGNSGATLATYYDFLPPDAVATGASIGGSSGFAATAAGLAIGISDIPPSMINGFPTHNRFPTFDSDFTVFEVRGDEVISIGIRDAIIDDDGGIGGSEVPEPSALGLLSLGLVGLGLARRRRAAA